MQIDRLIDDLLRLQTRYPSLIWRLRQNDGVEIEFYLEELALDCANILRMEGITADHLSTQPRVVCLSGAHTFSNQIRNQLIASIESFLKIHLQPVK